MYFPDSKYNYVGTLINVFTLLGSVVGQLTFGFLADYYGRTRLYGIELILVIVSTIGVATSNYGYNDLSFLGLFIWVSEGPALSNISPLRKRQWFSGLVRFRFPADANKRTRTVNCFFFDFLLVFFFFFSNMSCRSVVYFPLFATLIFLQCWLVP